MHYIYPDQILPPRGGEYPDELETYEIFGGQRILFRPIKPTDDGILRDLFYSLTDESIYLRYFSNVRAMPHEKLQEETNLDFETRMTIVAVPTGAKAEEMVALGQYVVDVSSNEAEASFIVRDDWQGKGIGRYLVKRHRGDREAEAPQGAHRARPARQPPDAQPLPGRGLLDRLRRG